MSQRYSNTILAIVITCLFVMTSVTTHAENKHNKLKVGLVLGGGGAKGAAEVGVLKYIEKSGIHIDYIVGTSIGSIVGGLYSCGYRSAQLDSLFSDQEWLNLLTDRNTNYDNHLFKRKDGVTYMLGFPIGRKGKDSDFSNFGIVRGDSITQLFDRITGRADSMDFNKLPIPFRCVAVDMRQLKEVVIQNGQLSKAMRASMSIPGFFKPVVKDSMLLVDGGVLNNLPVDVARDMGADVIIAIDLTQNKRKARDKEMKKRKGISFLLEWNKIRPDLKKYNINRTQCDVYINPYLKGYDATDFNPKKIKAMIKAGEKAGKEALSNLKKLKKQIDN